MPGISSLLNFKSPLCPCVEIAIQNMSLSDVCCVIICAILAFTSCSVTLPIKRTYKKSFCLNKNMVQKYVPSNKVTLKPRSSKVFFNRSASMLASGRFEDLLNSVTQIIKASLFPVYRYRSKAYFGETKVLIFIPKFLTRF